MHRQSGRQAQTGGSKEGRPRVQKSDSLYFLPSFFPPPSLLSSLSLSRTYVKASRVLAQYQHMPSFSGIQNDCQAIVRQLKSVLMKRLNDPNVREGGREGGKEGGREQRQMDGREEGVGKRVGGRDIVLRGREGQDGRWGGGRLEGGREQRRKRTVIEVHVCVHILSALSPPQV